MRFERNFFLIGMFAVLTVALVYGEATAEPKWVDAVPSCDSGGNVTIPAMPAGAKLLNVVIWDDVRGIPGKNLGPRHSFKLDPGQGFNFMWSDADKTYWQMITPKSRADGLTTDCDDRLGCKYLYNGIKQ